VYPAAFLTILPPKICGKKNDHQEPAKLTGFFLIKTRVSANNSIISIFSTGVDALPLQLKNRIPKQPNGARIGLQIDHLSIFQDIPAKCPDLRNSGLMVKPSLKKCSGLEFCGEHDQVRFRMPITMRIRPTNPQRSRGSGPKEKADLDAGAAAAPPS